MEKDTLKMLICQYIDNTNMEDIFFYESNPLTQKINEFGNFIYVKSNQKEVTLQLKFESK